MKKLLITLPDRIGIELDERIKSGKRSEYINIVLDSRWRELDTALTILSFSGISHDQILEAEVSVKLSSLPVIGRRSKALAIQLPNIQALQDGDESVAYALSVVIEELQRENRRLREILNGQ